MLPGREFILARVDEVRGGAGEGGGAGKQSGMESTHGRKGTLLLSRSEGERN